MALAGVLLIIAAIFDRLLKALALAHQNELMPLLDGILYFQPSVNPVGPLGLKIPDIFFFLIFILLALSLSCVIITERNTSIRAVCALALIGVLSNSADRYAHLFIVDVFALGGLLFNLADTYIIFSLLGYLFFYWQEKYRRKIIL